MVLESGIYSVLLDGINSRRQHRRNEFRIPRLSIADLTWWRLTTLLDFSILNQAQEFKAKLWNLTFLIIGEIKIRYPTKSLPILLSNTLFLSCHLASTKIITDGSLGGAVTRLTAPNYIIDDHLGTPKGSNLFHSFQTFNVGTGETATFISPHTVQNILARITGGDRSFIDGTINAQANLYLLNPYGFLFGQHALLNINGAFYTTTARGIPLGTEGDIFMASPSPQEDKLLSSAAPQAFGFLDSPPSTIEILRRDAHLDLSKFLRSQRKYFD